MLVTPDIRVEKNSVFDTHSHYDDLAFQNETGVFAQLSQMGVCGGIICGIDLASCNKILDITAKNSGWYAAVGFHPENLPPSIADIDVLPALAGNKSVVAIGEIGLDYYWDLSPRPYQKQCFEKQLEIAKQLNLPVIVHDRQAHADTLGILQKHKPRGVVHCFSGSTETSREVLKCGMYLGVGGIVTFKNAKTSVEVVKNAPLERLLLETDAPYLAPHPFRGKTNHSGLIICIAQKIAEIKNISTEQVLAVCKQNAAELFGIDFAGSGNQQ